MPLKLIKYTFYAKLNKKYINIFWESFDRVRNNISFYLKSALDELERV